MDPDSVVTGFEQRLGDLRTRRDRDGALRLAAEVQAWIQEQGPALDARGRGDLVDRASRVLDELAAGFPPARAATVGVTDVWRQMKSLPIDVRPPRLNTAGNGVLTKALVGAGVGLALYFVFRKR